MSTKFLNLVKDPNHIPFIESLKVGSIEGLQRQFVKLQGIDADKKTLIDQIFREYLLKFVITDDIGKIGNFIDLSVEAGRNDVATTTLPVILLGDIFDVQTLDNCEKLFTYVENNVAVWKEESFFTACKNNLLRMCNDLLRRLSRSQNTVFCGRILLFLAKFFPFSERSGLNIVSEFNLENLTEYESDGKDIGEALDLESVQVKIDYNLYCKFWALQDFFRNPNQCYNKVEWKTFASHATSVLAAFNSFKLDDQRESRRSTKDQNRQLNDLTIDLEKEEVKESIHFFAKFLTNPKLLALQLSDSNFRRSVLVQILILFQYLTTTVKFKAESFSLTTSQTDFIKETEQTVYKLLDETPLNGKRFSKTVRHMLQREELWNSWKNDGCKEFKHPDLPVEEVSPKPPPTKRNRKSLGDTIRDSHRQGKFYLGNNELNRLWNLCPDNLQACRGADRNFLPSIESYLENPKDKTDPSYEWRALRLLARQSPHFFTMVQTPNKVSDYLEGIRKKIHESKSKSKANENVQQSNATEIKSEDSIIEKDEDLDVQEETELLKAEQFTPDDMNTHKTALVSADQIKELAVIINDDWKRLANKLAYTVDEIKYFTDEHDTAVEQCRVMLQIWFEDDVDATLDNLAYILEGLELVAAADLIKRMLESPDKMEDISE